MLSGKWWISPEGSFDGSDAEHMQLATAYMLDLPKDRHVPNWWTIRGIPPEELSAALRRGADFKAVDFLSDKKNDARLWVMREHGWVRTAKNKWSVWFFDDATADMVRDAKAYWRFQANQGKMTEYEMIDVYEFKDGCEYSISVQKLLEGGRPQVLKRLATGGLECGKEESITPTYSTEKFSELERERLYGITGANPVIKDEELSFGFATFTNQISGAKRRMKDVLKDESRRKNVVAVIAVVSGFGYVVELKEGRDVLTRYYFGDSTGDSQSYWTGELNEKQLRKYALQTANEILDEIGSKKDIIEDSSVAVGADNFVMDNLYSHDKDPIYARRSKQGRL